MATKRQARLLTWSVILLNLMFCLAAVALLSVQGSVKTLQDVRALLCKRLHGCGERLHSLASLDAMPPDVVCPQQAVALCAPRTVVGHVSGASALLCMPHPLPPQLQRQGVSGTTAHRPPHLPRFAAATAVHAELILC